MKNNKILICPNCKEIIIIKEKKIYISICKICNFKFLRKNNYFDFLLNSKNDHFNLKSKNTWGKNLHSIKLKKKKEFIHSNIFIEIYEKYKKTFEGGVLEIGWQR